MQREESTKGGSNSIEESRKERRGRGFKTQNLKRQEVVSMRIGSRRAILAQVDLGVLVEIARVPIALDLGHVRRRDLLAVQPLPVDFVEPDVREDVARALR